MNLLRKYNNHFILLILCSIALMGCPEKNKSIGEKAGDAIEDATDNVKDTFNNADDSIEDAIDDATN